MKTILIVIDGFGIGAAQDAALYGDKNANTYKSIALEGSSCCLNMAKMGLNNIDDVDFASVDCPIASYGRLVELSKGKDTTTGHFEIAGLILDKPFPTYPNGFPSQVIDEFEELIKTKVLFNGVASGTEIINRYGDEHMRTGYPIVYTSADSVFQIAMSEELFSISRQTEICAIARKLLCGENAVARVIMRPFVKTELGYVRTSNRRDFSVLPFAPTMLDKLKSAGYTVYGIGKIEDIFSGCGITRSRHTHKNCEGLDATLAAMNEDFNGLIFTNLVDTDMLYGHRRDKNGYRDSIKLIDEFLPKVMEAMNNGDELIITSDHGCDPTYLGTDHTRENVPLLIYNGSSCDNLGTIQGFDYIARHILKKFNV